MKANLVESGDCEHAVMPSLSLEDLATSFEPKEYTLVPVIFSKYSSSASRTSFDLTCSAVNKLGFSIFGGSFSSDSVSRGLKTCSDDAGMLS